MSSTLSTATFTPAILRSYKNHHIKTSNVPPGMFFIACGCILGVVLLTCFISWTISVFRAWHQARIEQQLQESVYYIENLKEGYSNDETSFEASLRSLTEKIINTKRRITRACRLSRLDPTPVKHPMNTLFPYSKSSNRINNLSSMYLSPTDLLQHVQSSQGHYGNGVKSSIPPKLQDTPSVPELSSSPSIPQKVRKRDIISRGEQNLAFINPMPSRVMAISRSLTSRMKKGTKRKPSKKLINLPTPSPSKYLDNLLSSSVTTVK